MYHIKSYQLGGAPNGHISALTVVDEQGQSFLVGYDVDLTPVTTPLPDGLNGPGWASVIMKNDFVEVDIPVPTLDENEAYRRICADARQRFQ